MKHFLALLAALDAWRRASAAHARDHDGRWHQGSGSSGDNGPASKAAARITRSTSPSIPAGNVLFLPTRSIIASAASTPTTGVITTVAGDPGRRRTSGDGGPADAGPAERAVRNRGRQARKTSISPTASVIGDPPRRREDRHHHNPRWRAAPTFSRTMADPRRTPGLVEPNGVARTSQRRGTGSIIADVADNRVLALSTSPRRAKIHDVRRQRAKDVTMATPDLPTRPRSTARGPSGSLRRLRPDPRTLEGNTLRSVDPKSGSIRTIAGNGKKGYTGDGGDCPSPPRSTAPRARRRHLSNIVFIVDTENHVNPACRRLDEDQFPPSPVTAKRGGAGDGGDQPAKRPAPYAAPRCRCRSQMEPFISAIRRITASARRSRREGAWPPTAWTPLEGLTIGTQSVFCNTPEESHRGSVPLKRAKPYKWRSGARGPSRGSCRRGVMTTASGHPSKRSKRRETVRPGVRSPPPCFVTGICKRSSGRHLIGPAGVASLADGITRSRSRARRRSPRRVGIGSSEGWRARSGPSAAPGSRSGRMRRGRLDVVQDWGRAETLAAEEIPGRPDEPTRLAGAGFGRAQVGSTTRAEPEDLREGL